MSHSLWNHASDLIEWASTQSCRSELPALIRRLVWATVDPSAVHFPAYEGTQRPGWDGTLTVEKGNAWVPAGKSVWEMGCSEDVRSKAEEDYDKRTGKLQGTSDSTFVFVTPRRWNGKGHWETERNAEGKWAAVKVLDADDIEQWLEMAPSVDVWLARLLGKPTEGVQDAKSWWDALAATTSPPVSRDVLLVGREKTAEELVAAIRGDASEIRVSALSPLELSDFIAAVAAGNGAEEHLESRVLFVGNPETWNALCRSRYPLVLIPNNFPVDKRMVADAVMRGHHVVTSVPYTYIRDGKVLRLPRMREYKLGEALQKAGFRKDHAERLARESGGSSSILLRLASRYGGTSRVQWADAEVGKDVAPIILAGGWNSVSKADQQALERLSGRPYAAVEALADKWSTGADPLFRKLGKIYELVSREESWRMLRDYLTTDALVRLDDVAPVVLGERDPSYDMPPHDRYLASVEGKTLAHSAQLRKGLAETIALIGTIGVGPDSNQRWRAEAVTKTLLQDATAERWYSVSPLLPLLAEAAPDAFLDALDSSISASTLTEMLGEKSTFFSGSSHVRLVWALEKLCWDANYLTRGASLLARLAKNDPGGGSHPRPIDALRNAFRFVYPQTCANAEARIKVLERIQGLDALFFFDLVLSLLPSGFDTWTESARPHWRELECAPPEGTTRSEWELQTHWAVDSLFALVRSGNVPWSRLLKSLDRLDKSQHASIFAELAELGPGKFADAERYEVWSELRHRFQRHKYFEDTAAWAYDDATLQVLQPLVQQFAPNSAVERSRWLFSNEALHALGSSGQAYSETEALLGEARTAAVKDVLGQKGIEGVLELARTAQFPGQVGASFAEINSAWELILPRLLLVPDASERAFAKSYLASMAQFHGDKFLTNTPVESWPEGAVVEFAVSLPFGMQTWLFIRQRRPDVEPSYWRAVAPWAWHLSLEETYDALSHLLAAKRPSVACTLLEVLVHREMKPDWRQVVEVLRQVVESQSAEDSESNASLRPHMLAQLIKYLQDLPDVDANELGQLEWMYLSLGEHGFVPVTLHARLAAEPHFFVQVIELVFGHREPDETESAAQRDRRAKMAVSAFRLLESWTSLPGAQADGAVDAKQLDAWIREVRELVTDRAFADVVDGRIGRQLSFGPTEPDQSWPCKAVCSAIEAFPTEDVLRGFELGMFNQRGIHSRDLDAGGESERSLAAHYRRFADAIRITSPNTARALRQLAQSYEGDAGTYDLEAEAR